MIEHHEPVTVIVPVYRGVDDVAACLESVIATAVTSPLAVEVLAIDDASPEPEVSAYLAELAAGDHGLALNVLTNPENRGFVGTVNRGLAATGGDVVVLNADTVVTEGWLDRMADAATAPDVASVTPLTNFGSLCTMPASVIDAFNLHGSEPRIDACAAFVARHSLGQRPEVIAGVGFCLYLTRRALDRVGRLDEETFGAGYGEEVDFCLRASRIGLRHVVEDGTFVFHKGGVSFGDAGRAEGLARGSSVLRSRYPFFAPANRRERTEDPLAVSFAALELGLDERREHRPHVVHVLHSPPDSLGGTEKHLATLIGSLLDEFDASIYYPVESGFMLRTVWNTGEGTPAQHEFLLPGGPPRASKVHDEVAAEALEAVLAMFRVDVVHIQNLVNHSLAPLHVLGDFEGTVVASVRDLFLACPHHWLLYRNQQPCGIPEDLSVCERCLPETRGLSRDYLERFRATVAERLDTVDHWVFASQSAADYLLRAYPIPTERIELIEHGAIIDLDHRAAEPDEGLILDEPLRLAFVGLGWPKKGLTLVNQLADDLAGSSVEVHHLGELRAQPSPNLHTHGSYDNRFLPELLNRAGIHAVLLPAPYAETFGHVMTEALIAGRPVIGTDYGALAERIRRDGVGWTVDPTDPSALVELVENLDACRLEVLRASRAVTRIPIHPVSDTAEPYARLYRPPKPTTGDGERTRRATT